MPLSWRRWYVERFPRGENGGALRLWFSGLAQEKAASTENPCLKSCHVSNIIDIGCLQGCWGSTGTWTLAWHKNSLNGKKQTIVSKQEGTRNKHTINTVVKALWLILVLRGSLALHKEHPYLLHWTRVDFYFPPGSKITMEGLFVESELLEIRAQIAEIWKHLVAAW